MLRNKFKYFFYLYVLFDMYIILVLKCYFCYEVNRFEDCNIILECLFSDYVRK